MRVLFSILLTGLALCLAHPAWAQAKSNPSHSSSQKTQAPPVQWRSLDRGTRKILAPIQPKWKHLSPHQQRNIKQKAHKWETLPHSQQNRIRNNIRQWQRMSPSERRRARSNQQAYQNLPPRQRELVRKAYERFQHMSPTERSKLRQRWQGLTPGQRQAWIRKAARDHDARQKSTEKRSTDSGDNGH